MCLQSFIRSFSLVNECSFVAELGQITLWWRICSVSFTAGPRHSTCVRGAEKNGITVLVEFPLEARLRSPDSDITRMCCCDLWPSEVKEHKHTSATDGALPFWSKEREIYTPHQPGLVQLNPAGWRSCSGTLVQSSSLVLMPIFHILVSLDEREVSVLNTYICDWINS